MSEIKELTCINCPLGCSIKVEMNGDEIISVTGNNCNRGEIYARNEVISPVRVVTSSVRVDGGERAVVSVKTQSPIPKNAIFACTDAMKNIVVNAPVNIGDVILANIADTGVDLVATANVMAITK